MGQLINLGKENVGFSLSEYKQLGFESVSISLTSTNSYKTILDVTGEGFLNKALFNYGLEYTVVRITIDGSVLVWNDNVISGFVNEDLLNNNQDTTKVWASARAQNFRLEPIATADTMNVLTMPISSKKTGVVVSTIPLFFKSSCKVEIMKESGGIVGISGSIQGGLKA